MGLEAAYRRARDIIGFERAECIDVAHEVEQLRSIWRPQQVRIVLLAESHVWTSRDEVRSRVIETEDKKTGFARFVYCLGYGEPDLVEPAVKPNRGTPQYWRLFHDTVYGPNAPHNQLMKFGQKDCRKRVRNKLELLAAMQKAGIWLLDASVTALYREGAKLVAVDRYRQLLSACWDCHTGELVCGCEPSAVLIVGKEVYDAIHRDVRNALGSTLIDWIYQPQGRRHLCQQARDDQRRKCHAIFQHARTRSP